MTKTLTFSNFYRRPRFWRHASIWVFLFGMVFFLRQMEDNEEALIFIPLSYFLIEMMLLIYVSFSLYNKYINQKKYWPIVLGTAIAVICVSWTETYNVHPVINMNGSSLFWANLIGFPIFLLMAYIVKLAWRGVSQMFAIQKLENKQTESELKLLKSQINPHFLFNTLNNIYSTNLEDHDKANEIILELADLLRYQLESNKKQLTSLSSEIISLKNYIALEQIRVKECDIDVTTSGQFETVEIIPLVMLPFVENAFKYGTGIQRGAIEINFNLSEERLFTFFCKNKIVQKHGKTHSGGIGLENTKKRLELMYADKYTLDIQNDMAFFTVTMEIQL